MKKRRLRVDRILICLAALIAVIALIFFLINKLSNKEPEFEKFDLYVTSDTLTAKLYDINYVETSEITRGTKVTILEDKIDNLGTFYYKINYNNTDYLILEEDLVKDIKDTVEEKEIYVRTPITLYENENDSDIASFAKKGTKLEIVGFDKLDENGKVNMYKVKVDGKEGYAYSKYLVSTYEEAIKNYEEAYEYHKGRTRFWSYDLYGGSAASLDYYPYEKITFEDNVMPSEVKSLYLTVTSLANVDKYLELAKDSGINAFVIDIKEGGVLGYKSSVAQEYSPTSYKYGTYTQEQYAKIIQKIKDAGFYTIGRIVVFNDPLFAADNKSECIKDNYGNNTSWVSAYSRKSWEYNVKLSIEAVELFGFDEIQYDYVRFPEEAYWWSSNGYDYRNTYKEEKGQAIQNFLFYATDQIHKHGAYLSADVFGECSNQYVTAYGQYWPAISNVVDAISGMPYTDHFDRNPSNWENPYNTLYYWGLNAAARQKEIPTPAQARTWITAYNTPWWNPTVVYDASKIEAQIKGLYDAGLKGGYITWNGVSDYDKYKQIISAFKKEY